MWELRHVGLCTLQFLYHNGTFCLKSVSHFHISFTVVIHMTYCKVIYFKNYLSIEKLWSLINKANSTFLLSPMSIFFSEMLDNEGEGSLVVLYWGNHAPSLWFYEKLVNPLHPDHSQGTCYVYYPWSLARRVPVRLFKVSLEVSKNYIKRPE